MLEWFMHIMLKLQEVCINILPIALVIIGFQCLVIRKALAYPKKIFVGFIFVLVGIVFFLEGLELALFPLGSLMAFQLTTPEFLGVTAKLPIIIWQDYYWVYLFAASLGFASALAEPTLLAIAIKVEHTSGGVIRAWGFRISVAIGVAIGLALGTFRIVTGLDLYIFIFLAYIIVIIQTLFAPKLIIALAYDSGTITTSMVTVPLVTSLGIGLAEAVPGRTALIDGFGLIAFASLYPTITVLAYAQIAHWLGKRSLLSNT